MMTPTVSPEVRQPGKRPFGIEPAIRSIRQLVTEIPGRLRASGPGAHLLNFCPGAAELATGDAGAVYPAAEQRREILREMADGEMARGNARLPVVR